MSTTKLTLTYFPIGGKAEPIRLTAAAGGIAFTNKVMSPAAFKQAKIDADGTLPLGQLPILEIETDGEKLTLTQSAAILRYFGKLGGLYPTDDIEAMQVDGMMCILDDLVATLGMSARGAVGSMISDTEWTTEEKIAIRVKWMENALPRFLGFIEKGLESSESGWLVGDNVSIADIRMYTDLAWISSGVLDGIPVTVLEEYPCCLALMEKVKGVEGVKKWMDMYSKPYPTFDFEA
jgi:glutathione S-transferase